MITVQLASGENLKLDLSGRGLQVKQRDASFELVMHARDLEGNKLPSKRRVYRGDNPRAVEATFLKTLSEKEKASDVYAITSPDFLG